MNFTKQKYILAFVFVIFAAGCGNDSTCNICAAGATQICWCSADQMGVQTCVEGKQWSMCDCTGMDATVEPDFPVDMLVDDFTIDYPDILTDTDLFDIPMDPDAEEIPSDTLIEDDELTDTIDDSADTESDTVIGGVVGDVCTVPGDCEGVPSVNKTCVITLGGYYNFPNGYCSALCATPEECGDGSSCVTFFGFGSYCLKICTLPDDCRSVEGYQCNVVPGDPSGLSYCYPS